MQPKTLRYDDVHQLLQKCQFPETDQPALTDWLPEELSAQQREAMKALRFRLPGFQPFRCDTEGEPHPIIGYMETAEPDNLYSVTHLLMINVNGEIIQALSETIAQPTAELDQ